MKIGYPSSVHEDDRTIKSKAFGPQCWRLDEVEDLLFQGDEKSIRRLSRFGLYDNNFAELRRLEKFPSQAEDRLPGWSLHQLRKDGSASVAFELSEKSRSKFEHIPFEEFVRKAFGLHSPAIEHFLWQYQALSWLLCCKFNRKLKYKGLLFQLKEVSSLASAPQSSGDEYSNIIQSLENGKADPFVCAAAATAWEKVSNAENEDLDLKLNAALDLVIKPLQRTLKKPDSAQSILQELEDLKVRFRSHFYTPKANWDIPFDEPLVRLKPIGPSALAKALSEEDRVFYELNVQSSNEDPRSLRDINGRWNRLCCSAKECMDTGVVSALEMEQLAQVSLEACSLGLLLTIHFQELHRCCNFYSFTAVMRGFSLTPTPQERALLDLERDYKLAALLTSMFEFYPVDAPALSGDKMEYRSTKTEDTLECVGVKRVIKDLARQTSLGSCLSCFGH